MTAITKTAVIGASGYIGRHLLAAYREAFPEAIGTTFARADANLSFFDIKQPDIVPLRLEELGYQAVVIAAAKPNIAFCNDQKEAAHAVNVKGTLELIRQLGQTSLQTIFLSTNYVYDGASGNYGDDSLTAPTTEYGRQKALVENAIPELTNNFLILRISKVYGVEKGDKTLLDEMAGHLATGQVVQAATDEFFCPTFVHDLTAAILRLQSKNIKGTFNLSGTEVWCRYQMACHLAEEMQVDKQLVKSIALYDLPGMAGRPLNTTMKFSPLISEVQKTFTPLMHNLKIVAKNWAADRTAPSKVMVEAHGAQS
jgi:dTDP-4-dehydrorhamnose reductase